MGNVEIRKGSGNVYEDLGYPNAQEMRTKAELVRRISNIIKDQGLTQKKAAVITGIAQSDLSNLINGRFRGFSSDRIFGILLKLGQDIEINIQPAKRTPHIKLGFA